MPNRARRTARAAAARLFVDSSAWIALRSRRDRHHAEADRAFRAVIKQRIPLVTTNLVIAEVHRLTLFRVGTDAAMRVLDRIDESQSIAVHHAVRKDHDSAREWLARLAPQRITCTDAVSFAVMKRVQCSDVLGFDNDFVSAGFERWSIPI